ncbi:MAG TPA: SDR family NAD(P)-dependent oxidoreductase [Acidimicrobiia bacterium]|nr:SDR family NAD(P)-dependent oxidoreductase [Acidimicrobiia bacterium]
MTGRFSGRRALVTGSSRGIGAAVALRLAAEGASVAITARTLDRHPTLPGSLREVAERIDAVGTAPTLIVADLSDPDDRARIVPEAEAGLGGPVEVLVNNAAAAMYMPLVDYPLKRRLLTYSINVHAPIDLMQQVLPPMLARGEGWIVNLSSATARPAADPAATPARIATMAVYGSSKAALNRLTNGFAIELTGSGVRVNTVEPRAAVMSEGAAAVASDVITPELTESMEEMVEATIALCDCPPDLTGRVTVSLDLIDELGLTVRTLDGSGPATPPG